MTTYNLTDRLRFGEHKGDSIADIIADDPGYLEWALDEIDNFKLSDAAFQALERRIAADLSLNDDDGGSHDPFWD